MRDLAIRYRAAMEQSRAIVTGQSDDYAQTIAGIIDRLAPAIADVIENLPETTCPRHLALALENYTVAPLIAVLMAGIDLLIRERTLRTILEIKITSFGFECVETTDAVPSSLSGGLH